MKKTLRERFEEKFDRLSSADCWEWKASRNRGGYGQFMMKVNGFPRPVHSMRVSWSLYRGPIPEGLSVLHKCDNRGCVNPDHLFLGTLIDNVRDMVQKRRHWRHAKTHCIRGHELSGKNLIVTKRQRRCRTCKNNHANERNFYIREHNEMVAQYGFGARL